MTNKSKKYFYTILLLIACQNNSINAIIENVLQKGGRCLRRVKHPSNVYCFNATPKNYFSILNQYDKNNLEKQAQTIEAISNIIEDISYTNKGIDKFKKIELQKALLILDSDNNNSIEYLKGVEGMHPDLPVIFEEIKYVKNMLDKTTLEDANSLRVLLNDEMLQSIILNDVNLLWLFLEKLKVINDDNIIKNHYRDQKGISSILRTLWLMVYQIKESQKENPQKNIKKSIKSDLEDYLIELRSISDTLFFKNIFNKDIHPQLPEIFDSITNRNSLERKLQYFRKSLYFS